MIRELRHPGRTWAMTGLAAGLWFAVFYLPFSNFWLKISVSAALLAGLSILIQPLQPGELRVDRNALIQGCISAIFLYAIFWLGKAVSKVMFSFASPQIDAIYGKGEGTPLFLVFFLLLLVTGPSEELFWRRFLQQNLVKRYGKWPGWILATAVYAGVHIWSFNFMLIGAAAIAGGFWGLLYLRWKRITPVIISHALWSSMIFSVVPVP